jgi:hypothetical protein
MKYDLLNQFILYDENDHLEGNLSICILNLSNKIRG